MLVEDLIEQLSKFPKGTHVCIADIFKNLYYSDGSDEGVSYGIDPEFYVEYISEDVPEAFIALFFYNEDYEMMRDMINPDNSENPIPPDISNN